MFSNIRILVYSSQDRKALKSIIRETDNEYILFL
jgi:hypothetical protein